ncbi:MAG: valine--tRNA ligase [Saprospiraceae bacterium]|nr:valine--tRNA ligase [Saprospiraceae bacterium]
MSELSSRFEPARIEDKWYQHWLKSKHFKSTPDDREPYSIVIPPPNVTGVLHMGHMLNNTIQDVLIRKARMDGKNACWVPGTDHASIATEAKVVRWLRDEKGLTKSEVGRDLFIKYAWEWTDKYGGIILKQLQRLGASCDWDRTAFTMDEVRTRQVIQAFVDLYDRGKLYRDYRMVNWDSKAQTVLSNEEVIYEEEQTNLHHVRYAIAGSPGEWITIATTRPETILGDTAIAVHPEDGRYKHLHGRKAIVPLIGREIPIIADSYVDKDFGTGALKVTPAHDINDYEIGKRFGLEVIDVLTDDGHMSEAAEHYVGDELMTARKKMINFLKENDQLEKLEPYTHSVGRSERTNVVVEPRLSLQWYVKMGELAGPALEAVMTDYVEFFPKNQKNTYRHWMDNIRDWCISRQLWWGQRIPAYYYKDQLFVATTAEEALQKAREATGNSRLSLADLRQDEDVLDTWFSSWLWPFSVFDGMQSNKEVDYYYPTSVLVTGWDIIFLWVARMIMSGYEWKNDRPFKHVYFTGMVRDQQRRKMSKSLGNSPDALVLIDSYGADGVRFGILSSSPAGGDLLFDEKLCEQGRNFCNKIWNALRLIKGWEANLVDEDSTPAEVKSIAWLNTKMNLVIGEIQADFITYRLSDTQMKLYSFIWNDFCSWYLEWIKPGLNQPLARQTYQSTIAILSKLMQLLHPFMPFITEEIWHILNGEKKGDCMVSEYPKVEHQPGDNLLTVMEHLKEVIGKTRDLRNKSNLKPRDILPLYIIESANTNIILTDDGYTELLKKSAWIGDLNRIQDSDSIEGDVNLLSFVVGTDKYYLSSPKVIDLVEEVKTLQEDLDYQRGFVNSIRKKLDNERFVANAPSEVVDKERQKMADGLKRIDMIQESLARLSDN